MGYEEGFEQDYKYTYEKFIKLEELSDLPYGVLGSEIGILILFMFGAIVDNLSDATFSTNKFKKNTYVKISDCVHSEINKLFNIGRLQLQYLISIRLNFYTDILKNKLYVIDSLNLKTLKEKIIYTSSFIFYILSADKNVFETKNTPFASSKEIKNKTLLLRNENFKTYNDLDKFYHDYYDILLNIYDTISDKIYYSIEEYKHYLHNLEITNENLKKYKDAQNNKSKKVEKEKLSGCALTFWIIITIFFIFCLLCISPSTNNTTETNKNSNSAITQIESDEQKKLEEDKNIPKEQNGQESSMDEKSTPIGVSMLDQKNITELAKDAAFVKGFELINTTELEEFCSDSGYIPYLYINDFKKQFSKTILNAQNIIDELSRELNVDFYSQVLKKSGKSDVLENEFKTLQMQYNMSKHDYCKIFDNERYNIITEKIKIMKTNKPNMYLD